MSTYLDELAERLRAGGVPAERAAGIIDDLAGYLAEAGTDAEEEFGPVDAFAAQLTATASHGVASDAPGPSDSDENWSFHADAFNEMGLLREFGDQGWEVVSYDFSTGFDCRRSLERPQRWEYRREIVPQKRIDSVSARLAEDGWELAATYRFWCYFKRPVAATTGPAAELDAPPPAPGRRFYWSRPFVTSAAAYIAALLVVVVVASLLVSDSDSRLATLSGALVGTALVIAFCTAVVLYYLRKASRS